MDNFTFEEINLMCIYSTGTKDELIAELSAMKSHLQADENELMALTDTTIKKLQAISDAEFATLELLSVFVEYYSIEQRSKHSAYKLTDL